MAGYLVFACSIAFGGCLVSCRLFITLIVTVVVDLVFWCWVTVVGGFC